MEDKRRHLRRHIKAASDWLEKADKSIEQKDDVQGDLNLMLAKAELKNAEQHQNKSRLIKLCSILTAMLISSAILMLGDDQNPTPQSNLSTQTELNTQIQPTEQALIVSSNPLSSQIQPMESDSVQILTETLEPQNEPIYESQSAEPVYESVQIDEPVQETEINLEQTSSFTAQSDSVALEVKTPSEDMQKLMQSAGQILRAE